MYNYIVLPHEFLNIAFQFTVEWKEKQQAQQNAQLPELHLRREKLLWWPSFEFADEVIN